MTIVRLFLATMVVYFSAASTEAKAFEGMPSFAECAHSMECEELGETEGYILVRGVKASCPSGYYYVLNRKEQYVEPILVPCEPGLKVTLVDNKLKLELDSETEFVSLD